MKEMSVKKIVLCSIAAASALLLLIGLFFPVVTLSILDESTGATTANGFEMLAFKFPQVMRVVFSLFIKGSGLSAYESLLAVSSLLTILISVAFLAVILLALFRFSYKTTQKIILSYFISAAVIAIANLVIAIIFNVCMNEWIKEEMKGMLEGIEGLEGLEELYKCTTTSYLPLIFLVIFFVGYLVCRIVIPEKRLTEKEGTDTQATSEKRGQKSTVVEKLKQETAMIAVIRECKKLLEEEIISAADYVYLKSKLLAPVNKCDERCDEKEGLIVNLLREYKGLYVDEIITSAEFIEKKGELIAL